MRYLRGCLLALALIAVIAIPVGPAMALPAMSIPFVTVGNNLPMVFLDPQEAASLTIIETNTTHLAGTDTEALAISPVTHSVVNPSRAIFAPSIAQTTSQSVVGDRTYVFVDFLSA